MTDAASRVCPIFTVLLSGFAVLAARMRLRETIPAGNALLMASVWGDNAAGRVAPRANCRFCLAARRPVFA
ncbi:hypothetical protein BaRGS_00015907, partial [Batillaria attramentaria]